MRLLTHLWVTIASRGFATLLAVSFFLPIFFIDANKVLYLGIYQTYGVKNYNYTKDTIEAIKKHFDSLSDLSQSLRTPFDQAIGVFPCRTFNLDKQSASKLHKDHNNLSHGWCSVTALGDFDPNKGGHLVLWDLGLVIRFPPGSTILIPSSIILHSNTPIQPNEVRYSIVQYAAGHLFRWYKNGFLNDKEWKNKATPEMLQKWEKERHSRWQEAVSFFTTLEELEKTEERVDKTLGTKKRKFVT